MSGRSFWTLPARALESEVNITGNGTGAEYLVTPLPAVLWNVENIPNEAGNLRRFPNTVSVPYGFFLMLYMKSERRPIKSKGNS